MPIIPINLGKDVSQHVKQKISDIFIQTVENYAAGQDWQTAGTIAEGDVTWNAAKNSTVVMDGSTIQAGYDFSFEIKAMEVKNYAEFEKLKNVRCHINLHPVGMYIKNVVVNVEVSGKDNEAAKVVISGTKRVEDLEDVLGTNAPGV